MSDNTAKKTKPPACDACKARRVLCHRQPNGLPCPRCVEKGVLCTTTYVPRGRPRKNPLPVSGTHLTAPESPDPGVADQSSSLVVRSSLQPPSGELPSDLVQHLFECFTFSPHSNFPLLRRTALTATLSSLSWRIDLLPPDERVLAYCICAQSALISCHPAIIGPGPKPDSLLDRSVLFPGADLRIYGVRRSSACRALHQKALALAKDAGIYLQASDCNAASCFLLAILDETRHAPIRPWALAYISHIRSLAVVWNWRPNDASWAGFLMMESLTAILERKPVLPSYADQLLISGPEPPPLSSILESLATKETATQMVYGAIQPVFFHVSRLSRELYEKVLGEHTHRQPIAENAITDFFSALSTLQSIVSFLFAQTNWLSGQERVLFTGAPGGASDDENVRSIVSAMAVGSTSLTIALYRDLDSRYRVVHSPSTNTAHLDSGHQQSDVARLALLRNQAHAMAGAAVDDVVRYLKLRPYPPDFLTWIVVLPWAQFCLAEADKEGGVPAGRIDAFNCILDMLKAVGYSRDNPELHSLVDRMESHVSLSFSGDWAVASSSGAMQSDSDLLQQLSAQVLDTPPSFGLNDLWVGTLDSDSGIDRLFT
ncbi:hypothetical protein FB45DRAFT_1034917 [Roridomyces roridus]|uniref:Zn(2)-C6 fungal-type domain-containing protein n=1 Tax=Roridomyces roridus TaxID=1738132 RepID=A0AAD7BC21_9AGAR|nr:hypothetical protein FB45DRAFT_1034917 [Roridomyces roridus]